MSAFACPNCRQTELLELLAGSNVFKCRACFLHWMISPIHIRREQPPKLIEPDDVCPHSHDPLECSYCALDREGVPL